MFWISLTLCDLDIQSPPSQSRGGMETFTQVLTKSCFPSCSMDFWLMWLKLLHKRSNFGWYLKWTLWIGFIEATSDLLYTCEKITLKGRKTFSFFLLLRAKNLSESGKKIMFKPSASHNDVKTIFFLKFFILINCYLISKDV